MLEKNLNDDQSFCLQTYNAKFRARVANCAPRTTGASELHANVGVYDI